jgi:NTP pyrophosphatase (non-canonical NTP hydrolase)
MRGPQRCHTDFDRALLYSQLGTIFGEALIDRTDCFLGEPDWQAAFNDFINFETSAYKANEIKLWSLEVKIPGLMKEADEVIHAVDHASDVEQSSLHKRLRIHRKESLQLEEEAASRTDNEQDLYFKNLESLALAYGADILVNRTIISLDPRAADAAAIETETMGLADKVLATAQALQVHAQRGDLLVGRAILVARMANRTHNSVVSAIEGCGEFLDASKKHIAPNIWEDQCRLLGRKEFSGQGQR